MYGHDDVRLDLAQAQEGLGTPWQTDDSVREIEAVEMESGHETWVEKVYWTEWVISVMELVLALMDNSKDWLVICRLV